MLSSTKVYDINKPMTWLACVQHMNKIISQLIHLIFLLFLAESVLAQENTFGSARHAVGFAAGSTVGPGLIYRIYSPKSFYQGALFIRANSQDDISDFMISASHGRVLSEITVVKALPPTALVFTTVIEGRYSKSRLIEVGSNEQIHLEKSVHTGVGIALEIGNTFSPGLVFSIGTSYSLSVKKMNTDWEWSLGAQINIGLLYNW